MNSTFFVSDFLRDSLQIVLVRDVSRHTTGIDRSGLCLEDNNQASLRDDLALDTLSVLLNDSRKVFFSPSRNVYTSSIRG